MKIIKKNITIDSYHLQVCVQKLQVNVAKGTLFKNTQIITRIVMENF